MTLWDLYRKAVCLSESSRVRIIWSGGVRRPRNTTFSRVTPEEYGCEVGAFGFPYSDDIPVIVCLKEEERV